jgi:hypothetical protein
MKPSTIPLLFRTKRTVSCAVSLSLAVGLLLAGSSCSSSKTAAPERSETAVSAPTETLRIPRIATIQQAGNGSVSKVGNGWKVVTGGGGAYAAAVPIGSYGPGHWAGSVEARLRVTKGKIGVGLLTEDSHILNQQTVVAASDVQTVSLPVASNQNGKSLLLFGPEPSGTLSEVLVEAVDLALPAVKLPNAVSLAKIASGQEGALAEPGPPVHVVTAARPWSYAATFPLVLDNPKGTLFLRARVTTIRGEPYIGILNQDQKDFQSQELLPPGSNAQDVVVYIPSPQTAGSVIVRNGSKNGVSEVRIEDMAVYVVK